MQDDVPEIIERLKESHTRGLRPAFAYDRVSAEVQADGVSQEHQGANLYKAKKGFAPGHSPYGYKFDRKEKRHYIDKETEPACRYIFDEFDKGGHSLDRFVEHLNAKGITTSTGKPWRKGLLHRMLTNTFYHGEFFFRDRVWPGNHEPYYERARYEARIERFGDAFIGKKKRELIRQSTLDQPAWQLSFFGMAPFHGATRVDPPKTPSVQGSPDSAMSRIRAYLLILALPALTTACPSMREHCYGSESPQGQIDAALVMASVACAPNSANTRPQPTDECLIAMTLFQVGLDAKRECDKLPNFLPSLKIL